MTRYGCRTNNKTNTKRTYVRTTSSPNEEGTDEVDNIISKPLRGICDDSSDISIDTNESDDEGKSDYVNSSGSMIYSPSTNKLTAKDNSRDWQDISRLSLPIDSPKRNNGSCMKILLLPLVAVLGVFSSFYFNIFDVSVQKSDIIYDRTKFFNDLTYLGQKYKVTDNSLLQIKSGINTIFQNQDAGSFIFAYNSHNSNYDPVFFNNFMDELAQYAARFLRNDTIIQNHVIVDGSKLKMKVHSELIERYQADVTKTGVMLVKDIDEMPSNLAMAFHYYCDEYNPLIKKSAILFTLDMAKCSDPRTSHASIENCLARKWSTIPKDNIIPLLTRVVSIVVDVTL
ncbi:uncharacterized protein [Battus philenor]